MLLKDLCILPNLIPPSFCPTKKIPLPVIPAFPTTAGQIEDAGERRGKRGGGGGQRQLKVIS